MEGIKTRNRNVPLASYVPGSRASEGGDLYVSLWSRGELDACSSASSATHQYHKRFRVALVFREPPEEDDSEEERPVLRARQSVSKSASRPATSEASANVDGGNRSVPLPTSGARGDGVQTPPRSTARHAYALFAPPSNSIRNCNPQVSHSGRATPVDVADSYW